jgi:hypothetical protein
MQISALVPLFSICRLSEIRGVDVTGDFTFFAKTDTEISLVCPTEKAPLEALERSDGWRGFRVDGVLDFSLVGVLANISAVLAKENISIFAVSTYQTDYIFTKALCFDKALIALRKAGFQVRV